jgi:hypothetical protein
MSLGLIKRLIDEVRSFGTTSLVVFTGGEPFLLGEDLYRAVEYSARWGFSSRIVTNAYWATSPERACDVLTRLKAAGLSEINYSCDDFHQEFIPLKQIKWANEAAITVGVPALLAVKALKNSKITLAYLEDYFGVSLTRFRKGQDNPKNNVASFGITVPVGWYSDTLHEDEFLFPPDMNSWKNPCSSVLERIVMTPLGELAICCGIGSEDFPEATVGNFNDAPLIDLLKKANDDLIVNWLALEGPYGIMRFIQHIDPAIRFSDRYVNTCHLCHEIFTRKDTRSVLSAFSYRKRPSLSIERAWFENHRGELFQPPASAAKS